MTQATILVVYMAQETLSNRPNDGHDEITTRRPHPKSSKVAIFLPEFRPGLAEIPAKVDVAVIARLFVQDSVAVLVLRHYLTRLKPTSQAFRIFTEYDHRLRRRVAVALGPK